MSGSVKLLPPVKRVGLLANRAKEGADQVLREAVEWVRAHGAAVIVGQRLAADGELALAGVEFVAVERLGGACDVLISIGGDGTLIGAARAVMGSDTPVLGVNLGGKLGYLTELDAGEMPEALAPLIEGGLLIEERMTLRGQLRRGGREAEEVFALNDLALVRGAKQGVLEVALEAEEEPLGRFLADGVVVCTPTGSTAYSLSAGGPVLHPNMDALVVTPICPHTLSIRPVVLAGDHEVRVTLGAADGEGRLTVDGHEELAVASGDSIHITRSPHRTRLVRWGTRSFYSRLREKLEWGGWRSNSIPTPGAPEHGSGRAG
jgi:NAD+ kinase